MSIGFLKTKETEEFDSAEENFQTKELRKMKKTELLEIMLKQGEEIDRLRARVEELEAEVAEKEAEMERHEFEIQKFGSIAEASLQVTDIFKEAEKAAKIYLENLRRRYG